METLILLCLLFIILLLLYDKIAVKPAVKKDKRQDSTFPGLPAIMGQAKPHQRLSVPLDDTDNQRNDTAGTGTMPGPEIDGNDPARNIPVPEVPEQTFSPDPDLAAEEEEWNGNGAPNGEDGFATGVSFEELSTLGSLLQQEMPEEARRKHAADIVHRIQGTELLHLLENSMDDAARKIAWLLDGAKDTEPDPDATASRNTNPDAFDIGEYL